MSENAVWKVSPEGVVCPCCTGAMDGEFDALCDQCAAAALTLGSRQPHGCLREDVDRG